ncbi:DUF4265 domain-containing protein [Sphingobacterium sp. DR205]|uniref:DUF4265 domain-containing protein n=1 Tax=Sphingobacterium sp. DR205 TaxID=2713573 RepID=UPI0013E4FB9C|nr:DUF4265 domain-containing protein [Sphingobacterium sp. DR205]QIH34489.1 DUF4265 domain-containing protein [Sphingobacterium sp. DR205]
MNKKVILTYYDVEENLAEEALWIEPLEDNKYQVKNVPFFAPNIAYNDIITVEDDEGNLYFEELVKASEHSTIQIVIFNEREANEIIKNIEHFGCSWEGMENQTILAVDVPPSVNYSIFKKYLDKNLTENIFDYKEACLSETHLNLR